MSTINTNMPEGEFLAVSRPKIISNFQVISDFIDDSVAVVVPLTLNASSWSSGNYTIINSAITANSVITISPSPTMTSDQYDAIAVAKIVEGSISSEQVVLKSLGVVPTIDCPVVLMISKVSALVGYDVYTVDGGNAQDVAKMILDGGNANV